MEFRRVDELDMMSYPVGENISRNLETIDLIAELISREYRREPLNIWCRGSSGAIVAAIIAKDYIQRGGFAKVCHVKKQGEHAHSSYPHYNKEYINIMVDDFISSGDTVKAIWNSQQRYTRGLPMHSLVVTSGSQQVHEFFSNKLKLIISQ